MIRAIRLVLAAALTLLVTAPVRGQDSDLDRAFVTAFVAAVNAATVDARLALVHPQSRACTTGGAGEWWADSVARQAREPIPAKHRWTIKPVPAGEPPPFGDKFDYPIRATHTLQLDMQPQPYRLRTVIVQLARAGDRWGEVVPCAKPEIQATIRAAIAAKAKRAARVETLLATMPAAQRDDIVAQIKAGRRIDAAKSYAQSSGEDLTTATEVVDRLVEGTR